MDLDADRAYTGRLVPGSGLEGCKASRIHSARGLQLRIGAVP